MNEIQLSWKCTDLIFSALEKEIKKVDVHNSVTRSSITERAINVAKEQNINWLDIKSKIALVNIDNCENVLSMQVFISDDLNMHFEKIKHQIDGQLNEGKIRTGYAIKLIWTFYLDYLKKERLKIGKPELEDINGPEMIKILSEIIILNDEKDFDIISDIKQKLIKWKNNGNI